MIFAFNTSVKKKKTFNLQVGQSIPAAGPKIYVQKVLRGHHQRELNNSVWCSFRWILIARLWLWAAVDVFRME